jgi:hypothetical protein
MGDMATKLMESLGFFTTAYAIVVDGILDATTIHPNPNVSMLGAAHKLGHGLQGHGLAPCGRDCDCIARHFAKELPNCKLVHVQVAVIEEPRNG